MIITLIIVIAYILNVFLNRYITYRAVKNGGIKDWMMSYSWYWVWFVPFVGNAICIVDFLSTISNNRGRFGGKDW